MPLKGKRIAPVDDEGVIATSQSAEWSVDSHYEVEKSTLAAAGFVQVRARPRSRRVIPVPEGPSSLTHLKGLST